MIFFKFLLYSLKFGIGQNVIFAKSTMVVKQKFSLLRSTFFLKTYMYVNRTFVLYCLKIAGKNFGLWKTAYKSTVSAHFMSIILIPEL